jgi:hypothetical protein
MTMTAVFWAAMIMVAHEVAAGLNPWYEALRLSVWVKCGFLCVSRTPLGGNPFSDGCKRSRTHVFPPSGWAPPPFVFLARMLKADLSMRR